jgi:hypothetical protein
VKVNLGCGKRHRTDEGWVNIDKSIAAQPDRIMDLFAYPWDIPDNSIEEFQIHHLAEHIPHEPRYSGNGEERYKQICDFDGFYCFFCEVWRIGVHNARVEVVVPYAMSPGAFQDPTHIRYMVPQSFAYLTDEIRDNDDFDYMLPPMRFTVTECHFDIPYEVKDQEADFIRYMEHHYNATRNMYVELRILK